MRVIRTALVVIALTTFPALADDVPAELVGHWAVDGACDKADSSIHVETGTLAMGAGEPAAITFAADDSPSGNGAIHWAEEGNVDNFEFDKANDVLLYNAQGYGMGVAAVTYKRCPS